MLLIGVIIGVVWVLLVIVAVVLCSVASRSDAQSDRSLGPALS
ncbi:MAG TPA: hypothetical protein VMU39_23425 [Solirubrobacteraceae bacterium]|nr:hypothetical protein [Solirubrobacteraceae bacterium]